MSWKGWRKGLTCGINREGSFSTFPFSESPILNLFQPPSVMSLWDGRSPDDWKEHVPPSTTPLYRGPMGEMFSEPDYPSPQRLLLSRLNGLPRELQSISGTALWSERTTIGILGPSGGDRITVGELSILPWIIPVFRRFCTSDLRTTSYLSSASSLSSGIRKPGEPIQWESELWEPREESLALYRMSFSSFFSCSLSSCFPISCSTFSFKPTDHMYVSNFRLSSEPGEDNFSFPSLFHFFVLEAYPSTTIAVERGDRKHPHEYDFQATKAKSGKPMKILEGLATFENGFEIALAW